MNRIIRLLPRRQVAPRRAASGRRNLQIVIIVDVARRARNVGVAESQREAGGTVVEVRRVPTLGRVTVGTVCEGKSRTRRRVDGVGRFLPSGQVAARIAAVGRSDLQIVVVVDVAIGAGHVGVAIDQQEAGRRVIEFCVEPGVKTVASVAGGREFRACVIRIGS